MMTSLVRGEGGGGGCFDERACGFAVVWVILFVLGGGIFQMPSWVLVMLWGNTYSALIRVTGPRLLRADRPLCVFAQSLYQK
jgi:hypothetical protein